MTASAQSVKGPIRRLFDSATGLLTTVLALGRTRLELLTVEVELEIRRVAAITVWLLIAVHATVLTLVLCGFWIILLFWDSHRLLVTGLVAGFFALTALIASLMLGHRLRTKPPALQGTLAELAQDIERLRKPR